MSGPNYGEPVDAHPGIAVGDELVVLSMLVDKGPWTVSLQVLRSDGERDWFPAGMFETVSSVVPSNWVSEIWSNGSLHISPEAWLERGFYEGYVDGERNGRAAREIYERELATILAES
jgi:hypothetical protein